MFGTPSGEIPSVGKVELFWIQTPLPPVTPITPTAALSKGEDIAMGMGMDEGDAMASGPVNGGVRSGQAQEQQDNANLDYDVADDNEWGVQ
jgi:RNA-binding protein 26